MSNQSRVRSLRNFVRTSLAVIGITMILFPVARAAPIAPSGFTVEPFASVVNPFHLAFDKDGNLYVGRENPGNSAGAYPIHRVSSDGSVVVEFGPPIPDPDGVIVDEEGLLATYGPGSILVAGEISPAGKIRQISPNGLDTATLFTMPQPELLNPQQLVFDDQDRLLFAACRSGAGGIGIIEGGVARVFNTTPVATCLGGIAIDQQGHVFVSGFGDGTIKLFDANGNLLNSSFVSGLHSPDAMALDERGLFGNDLFVVERGAGTVVRVDPNTGDHSVFATGLSAPFGLAFGPDGCLYVADNNSDSIWRICALDVTPPYIVCPPDLAVSCSDSNGAQVSFSVTATDDVDVNPVVSCTPTSGTIFPLGSMVVHCTATDAAGNEASCSFTVTVTEGVGDVEGNLSANCPAAGTPILGVIVDAFDGNGVLVGTAVTDANGHYQIDSLPSGQNYTIGIVTPLGYSAQSDVISTTVHCNSSSSVSFSLVCTDIAAEPRTIGFWKHQVAVALFGKGKAQIDAATLCHYLDLIQLHFNSNAINQVIVYEPPVSDNCTDKLNIAKDLLNMRGYEGMAAKARQQLMASLLNVAAGYISLSETVSEDGASLSQAITYSDRLIDGTQGDHEIAKDICDLINNSQLVPAGVIPLDIDDIAYKHAATPDQFGMAQNYPNPFNAGTTISYSVDVDAHVTLQVYNVLGQRVTTLVDVDQAPGEYAVEWEGHDAGGKDVASGIYLYRIQVGERVLTRKMTLLR